MPSAARSAPHRRWHLMLAPSMLSAVAVLLVAGAAPASAVGTANSISVALPPTAIAIDHATHTAYVAVNDGVDAQIAVVDTSICTAVASPHCTGEVTAVRLPGSPGPAALAYDSKNHTVYVADANIGNVAMIDASTCNATTTSGCTATPKVAPLGLTAPTAIAVDTSHHYNAIYVADEGHARVAVFQGKNCDATKTAGCSKDKRVAVGSAPSALAVDASVGTVYVANLGDNTISRLDEAACSTPATVCKTHGKPVDVGSGTNPVALAAAPALETLFIADSGPGALSMINTAKCNSTRSASCAKVPRSHSGLANPEGIALVSEGRVAVADAGRSAIVVFGALTCNANHRGTCGAKPELNRLNGSPVAVAVIGRTVYAADATMSSLDAIAVPTIRAKVTSKHHKSIYGWYRSPIKVRFICHAGSAPLKPACPASRMIKKNGRGHLVSATVTSTDGGSATITFRLNLDRTKPTVKVLGVVNGKTYTSPTTLRCHAHDALSGVASCSIKRHHHGHVVHYVATAKDRAGNVAKTHGKYLVS
jgi:DNA-binding beta-propeller fold protein YncE